MFNFIEDTNTKLMVNIKKGININVVIDTIKMNICNALYHIFLISEQFYLQFMNKEQSDDRQITIWTRYVICNRTQLMFRVGQSETNEMMSISPGFCVFYSFRSCYQNKELIFQIVLDASTTGENQKVITSHAVSIVEDCEQYVALGENILIVKIFPLSATQKCIIIKGQIEIISATDNKFNLQFRSSGTYGGFPEIQVNNYEHLSIFGKCVENEELHLRLRFSESIDDQIRWSGSVPLKSRKGLPWLVKIPINNHPEFISYWVRIVRENMDLSNLIGATTVNVFDIKPVRILIIIYPMFLIQSNFTLPLNASIKNSAHNQLTLNGKGEIIEINVAATNETQHEIVFDNEFPNWHGETRKNAILTFSNIDWDKFFWYDEKKIKIEDFIKKLSEPLKNNWPYGNLNINGVTANIRRDIQCNQIASDFVPFIKCLPYQHLSCSLAMSISPWCLFINTLTCDVTIKVTSSNEMQKINAGKIGMLFPIENSFVICLHTSDTDKTSDNINLYYSDEISIQDLQQNNILQLFICQGCYVSRILLEYNFNDGVRAITLSSIYSIVNFSKYKMYAYPFCLTNNDKLDRDFLEKTMKQYRVNVPKVISKSTSVKGMSLDKFYHFELNNQKTNSKMFYNFFICLTIENEDISFPLPLSEAFNRKCFSLYAKDKSIPFAAVCTEKKLPPLSLFGTNASKSQYYLFIYDDSSPVLLIDNQTDISYCVAETKTTTATTTTSAKHRNSISSDGSSSGCGQQQIEIISECNENLILWTNVLRPMSQTYFTPPSAYQKFPDTEKYHCDITLALRIEDESAIHSLKSIQWSAPIHTGYRSEKYFNVPLHGDVKIIVCDKHNTIKVFIFYVSQQTEFCIKDLRTRLSDPSKTIADNQSEINAPLLFSISQEKSKQTSFKIDNEIKDRRECNHELPEFPVHVNLFASEICVNFWSEPKRKPYLSREILSFFIDDITVTFNGLFKTLEVYVNNIQADNQLYSTGNYDFPVILCPEIPYIKHEEHPTPAILKKAIKMYREKHLALFHINFYDDFSIETIHCQLNPIRIYIEDVYLKNFIEQMGDTMSENNSYLNARKTEIFCEAGEVVIPKEILQHAMSLSEPLKLRYVRIDPLNVILTVHTSVKLYVGFDHSSLAFSQYDRRNLLTVPMRLGQTIGMHYFSGILFSCGWVVGSLEILGSPSGLARSFTTGIRDFVSMPIQGLFRGPWGFFVGISQGSVSLFRNVTAGALNSVTKLATSVSRNLDRLTLDEEHFQRTEALRRSRPQGLTQGLSNGLTGFGINLLGAIGGISRHTLEARSTAGIVAGLGKGIFGAIAKPISGAADLLALTGQGMLHTVGYNTLPEQRSRRVIRMIPESPAECKILWQLIPSVLSMDQILFYHEATLIEDDELKRAQLILTTSVLTLFDMEKDQLVDILPIERVDMTFDSNDKTLINIKLLSEHDQENDNSSFTNERIMRFLKASNDSLQSMTRYSLDGLLQTNQKTRLQWSLYISEHLGQHLLGYLNLIKNLTKNFPK